MAGSFDLQLFGDKKLDKALGDLSRIQQRKVMRTAQRAAFKPLLKQIKSAVPVDTGDLRKSIKLRALKRSRVRSGVYIRTGTRDELNIGHGQADSVARTRGAGGQFTSTGGTRRPGYYPAHVEFGHDGKTPVSYIRATFDANKETIWRRFHTLLWDGIKKVWSSPI